MKAPGKPAWDVSIESPSVSIDKSYGVSWLDLTSKSHRLVLSDTRFGSFTFVPDAVAPATTPGATFIAVLEQNRPRLLRIEHTPNFNDQYIDLAGTPVDLGYLQDSGFAYVTQAHPWGRVTFVDAAGTNLRHVTGFAMP
jgi:hypothetical protein